MQAKKVIISIFAAFLIGGCILLTPKPSPTPDDQPPTPGSNQNSNYDPPVLNDYPPVSGTLQDLNFAPPELGERINRLDACINNYAAGSEWRYIPYQTLGNLYEARWCSGEASRLDCTASSGTLIQPGQRRITLYTLRYNFPDMFGLGFQALLAPEDRNWTITVSYAEGGRSIVGEGFGINYNQFVPGSSEPDATISLGSTYTYTVDQIQLIQESSRPAREELAVYLASPESLRQRGVEQLRALENKVLSAINNHQLTGCDWTKYKNDGIPPQCIPRPMTTAEEEAAAAQVIAYFQEQTNILEQHSQEIHAALLQAFPFESCWE